MENITREDFEAYKDVQDMGKVNMMNIRAYNWLIGLTVQQCLYIMHNYEELENKYNNNNI